MDGIEEEAREYAKASSKCPRCNGLLFRDEYEDLVCHACGYVRYTERPITKVRTEKPLKPIKRVRGISAKESRRLYRLTPAGQAAWRRYRYSELFYEAQARYRKTEGYKESQRRFKEKIKLFKRLSEILEGCTHPYLKFDGKIFKCKKCNEVIRD